MIYVASPYTSPDPTVMEFRYNRVCDFIDQRLTAGEVVFSPIVYCHHTALRQRLPSNARYWRHFNFEMFRGATELYILELPEWQRSAGVIEETEWAINRGLTITHWTEDFERCEG